MFYAELRYGILMEHPKSEIHLSSYSQFTRSWYLTLELSSYRGVRKTKKDYKKGLKAILEALSSPPVVQNANMDFELSLWKAFPKVYPGVETGGCTFHWIQAVWRKFQFLGLQQHMLATFQHMIFVGNYWLYHFYRQSIWTSISKFVEHASSRTQLKLATYYS